MWRLGRNNLCTWLVSQNYFLGVILTKWHSIWHILWHSVWHSSRLSIQAEPTTKHQPVLNADQSGSPSLGFFPSISRLFISYVLHATRKLKKKKCKHEQTKHRPSTKRRQVGTCRYIAGRIFRVKFRRYRLFGRRKRLLLLSKFHASSMATVKRPTILTGVLAPSHSSVTWSHGSVDGWEFESAKPVIPATCNWEQAQSWPWSNCRKQWCRFSQCSPWCAANISRTTQDTDHPKWATCRQERQGWPNTNKLARVLWQTLQADPRMDRAASRSTNYHQDQQTCPCDMHWSSWPEPCDHHDKSVSLQYQEDFGRKAVWSCRTICQGTCWQGHWYSSGVICQENQGLTCTWSCPPSYHHRSSCNHMAHKIPDMGWQSATWHWPSASSQKQR